MSTSRIVGLLGILALATILLVANAAAYSGSESGYYVKLVVTQSYANTLFDDGFAVTFIVSPQTTGLLRTEAGYNLNLNLYPSGVGGGYTESGLRLYLVPEQAYISYQYEITANDPPSQILFDTGRGTYPSISGVHNGTITPSFNVSVSKLYTYPCAGTGGYTEYVVIRCSNGTVLAEAHWNGYTGDWHNLTFNNSFMLKANETYNYTIRTGSYPQIIHEPSWNATGGVITCAEFMDINGKRYEGWIPAIRLS
jgi:hypothetical protein